MLSSEDPRSVPSQSGTESSSGSGFTAGRIIAVICGVLAALGGLGLAAAAAMVVWADQTQRDSDGYLSTGTDRFSTPFYALRFETIDLEDPGGLKVAARWLSSAQVRVGSATSAPVFVGIGPTAEVNDYLTDVAYDRVIEIDSTGPQRYRPNAGDRVPEPPDTQDLWVASTAGPGEQILTWQPEAGRWALVVMNADASPVVIADISAGVKAPTFTGLGIGLFLGAAAFLIGAALLIFFGLRHQVHPVAAP